MSTSSPTDPGSRAGYVAAVIAGSALRVVRAPLHRLAVHRMPEIADPAVLQPGSVPPTGGRLLILFDGDCGICLHARDVILRLDHHGRLAHDRLQRHAGGLLAALPAAEREASWHVIDTSGRRSERGPAMAMVLGALPGGRVLGPLARLAMPLTDRAYRWFAVHRSTISRRAGLIQHPDRDAAGE